jgi:hypothetical protein
VAELLAGEATIAMDQAVWLAVGGAERVGVVQRGGGVGAEPGDHRRRQPIGLGAVLPQLPGMDAVDVLPSR